ncbi:MAG: GAF domain-containing protein [Deltaproteobacteria bacterium]|nr:GAF domain-containing protein [Deltaproteobacteria bacterium]
MALERITEEDFQSLENQKELYARVLREATEELESRIQELSLLRQVGDLFRSSSRLEDTACRALTMFLRFSEAENGSIMLVSEAGELAVIAAAGRGVGSPSFYGLGGYPRAGFRPGEGVAGRCFTEGKALLASDAPADPSFVVRSGGVEVGSLACLPLVAQGHPLGVLNLSHSTSNGLDEHRMPLWSILADSLAVALSNALLFQQLRDANLRLEEQVRRRTEGLEAANRQLQQAKAEIAGRNELLQERVRERTQELETALAELRSQHAELEQANRVKDEFLNNINHELKTPLNAIIGYTGLLLRETEGVLPEEQRADLELVEANGKHLQSILESILALKDIERGTIELDRRPEDLNELLRSAVASVRPRARAAGLELSFEPLDVPPVWIDHTLILRVVYNLLDNAIKFAGRGRITVRSRISHGDPAPHEREADEAGGIYAVVDVEDQGPGIRPEDMDRIFEKFQQIEPPMKKHKGGSGIGLAISKHLVEIHGGRLWVRSRPGNGSTFSFSLPFEVSGPA